MTCNQLIEHIAAFTTGATDNEYFCALVKIVCVGRCALTRLIVWMSMHGDQPERHSSPFTQASRDIPIRLPQVTILTNRTSEEPVTEAAVTPTGTPDGSAAPRPAHDSDGTGARLDQRYGTQRR